MPEVDRSPTYQLPWRVRTAGEVRAALRSRSASRGSGRETVGGEKKADKRAVRPGRCVAIGLVGDSHAARAASRFAQHVETGLKADGRVGPPWVPAAIPHRITSGLRMRETPRAPRTSSDSFEKRRRATRHAGITGMDCPETLDCRTSSLPRVTHHGRPSSTREAAGLALASDWRPTSRSEEHKGLEGCARLGKVYAGFARRSRKPPKPS